LTVANSTCDLRRNPKVTTLETPQSTATRLAAIVGDVGDALRDLIRTHRVTWDE
jgi:hypothetical protein